jgi:NDP-sugar pyrophosphorylase family protein
VSELADRQVVVLAGGLGTRLSSLGGSLPKALRPVGGRPFVDVMVDLFARQGFRRFHFCLGHQGDRLARHLQRLDPALEVTYEAEATPRGTGGALLRSAGRLADPFLLTMGDTFLDLACQPLFDELPPEADGLLVVSAADSEVTPNVGLEGRTVTAYDKRGVRGGWTDTGIAILRRRALEALDGARGPVDLSALFLALIDRGSLRAAVTAQRFYDIGTPTGYRTLDRHFHAGAGGDLAKC